MHLGLELLHADRQPPAVLGAHVVVHEDGHELVAPRKHPDRVPFVLGDHDFLALGKRPEPAVVLDHPALAPVAEVARGEGLGSVARLRGGDDEVFRLEGLAIFPGRPRSRRSRRLAGRRLAGDGRLVGAVGRTGGRAEQRRSN